MNHTRVMSAAANVAGIVLLWGLWTAPASAQEKEAGETPDQTVDRVETTNAPPTAEDMLKELRRAHPINDVISPVGSKWAGDAAAQRKLWPEGWSVVDRSGFLKRDGDWWLFAFEPDNGDPPIRLIPNANLEVLVRTAVHVSTPVKFIISGLTTVFKDRNYLLVRSVTRDRQAPDLTKQPTPATNPDVKPVPTTASTDDVLGMMQDQAPETDLLDTRGRLGVPEAASATRTLLPDGATVINRPARVVRQGALYRLVFESDHPDNPEPPLTMLPNQNMMRMTRLATTDNLGLVFIVSGEVTQFQGENFVLVQSATQRMASGNFHK